MMAIDSQNLEQLKAQGPERISEFLVRHGWERHGGREGIYERLRFKKDEKSKRDPDPINALHGPDRIDLIMPLDQSWADYDELLSELLLRLATFTPEIARIMRKELLERSPGDQLKFKKDVPTIKGAVAWSLGKDLIWSAENILLAGAKTRLHRRAYYGQVNGQFAHRFLDSVLMGQTEIGSYVVTAFAPAQEAFPDKVSKSEYPTVQGVGTYTGREIVESVVEGLESTLEALDHHRSTNSLSGFERGVRNGVSKEMVQAVRTMVLDSEGADVTVDWTPEVLSNGPAQPATRLSFESSAAPVLERAAARLASLATPEMVTAIGWLSLVSRPSRGGSGLVRLRVAHGSEASSLQIPLDGQAFERAASAIGHEQQVIVTGRQERDGNRYWLYDAQLEVVAGEPPEEPLFYV